MATRYTDLHSSQIRQTPVDGLHSASPQYFLSSLSFFFFFFFNDTATTEIYTLSLHDALPIWFPQPLQAQPAHTLAGVHSEHEFNRAVSSFDAPREHCAERGFVLINPKREIGRAHV